MRKDYPFNFVEDETDPCREVMETPMTLAYAPPEYFFPQDEQPEAEKKESRLVQCPECGLFYERAKNDRCPRCLKEKPR